MLYSQDALEIPNEIENPQWQLMISELEKASINGLTDWLDIIKSVDRLNYVPSDGTNFAYSLTDIIYSDGSIQLSPLVYLNLFDGFIISDNSKILLYGEWASYGAELLSQKSNNVYVIQLQSQNLNNVSYSIIQGNVNIQYWIDQGPFDVILVTSTLEALNTLLIDQLAPRGTIIVALKESEYSKQWIRYSNTEDDIIIDLLHRDGSN
jgi:protein-L-isoaspartate O-methyltransferase